MPNAHDDKITAPLALLIEDCKKELSAISKLVDNDDGSGEPEVVDGARVRRREVHEVLLHAHDRLVGRYPLDEIAGDLINRLSEDDEDEGDDEGDDEDEDEGEDDA